MEEEEASELLCRLLEDLNLNLIRLHLGTSSLHLYRGLMQLDVQKNCSQLRIMGSPSLLLAVQQRHREQTTLWYNPVRTELTHTHTLSASDRIIMYKCTYVQSSSSRYYTRFRKKGNTPLCFPFCLVDAATCDGKALVTCILICCMEIWVWMLYDAAYVW